MAEHGAEAQLRHAPSARKSCRHVARPESVACPPTDEFARGHHRLVAFPGAERGCAPHYPQRRDGRVAVLQPLLRHEQFDETDASVFTAETAFHDLDEYSSLIALSIIAMVDEEYDVALKGDDMKSAVTIEDLYNTVMSKM